MLKMDPVNVREGESGEFQERDIIIYIYIWKVNNVFIKAFEQKEEERIAV